VKPLTTDEAGVYGPDVYLLPNHQYQHDDNLENNSPSHSELYINHHSVSQLMA